jgi:16S rRNA (adenine1518-N6/adenine1519-N6)-dimethyltransferase
MKLENAAKSDLSQDQHFMTNEKTVEKIVSAARLEKQDKVLEIGAGTGILTKMLAKKGAKIIAIEIDRSFRKMLGKIDSGNVEIIYGNALDVIDNIAFNKVVSNMPYSICEPLVSKLMKRDFSLAVLSVPEGFYKTITSKPGEKNYSLLTLKVNSFFTVSLKMKIKKEDFAPPPKTESVVVAIKPLSKKAYAKRPDKFILRELFLQRTKRLKNALMEGIINLNKKIFFKDFTKNMAREVIARMGMERGLLEKESGQLTLKDLEKIGEKIRHFS